MTAISPRLFPVVLIVLDVAAAAVYGARGDWARVLYWLAAGLITFSTLLM